MIFLHRNSMNTDFCIRKRTLATLALLNLVFCCNPLNAETYWETVVNNAAVVIDTSLHNLTASQEVAKIRDNWDKYYLTNPLPAIGQMGINGTFPVVPYTDSELGNEITLSFLFVDPATGHETTSPYQIASVHYEALVTPPTLDKSLLSESYILSHLVDLGTSSDSQNNFAFNTTLLGFEPQYFAFAYDSSGTAFSSNGIDGFASTVNVPEPASLAQMSVGLIALFTGVMGQRLRRPLSLEPTENGSLSK